MPKWFGSRTDNGSYSLCERIMIPRSLALPVVLDSDSVELFQTTGNATHQAKPTWYPLVNDGFVVSVWLTGVVLHA